MSHQHGQGYYGQPVPSGAVHTQVVTQPYRSSTAHIVIAWIVAVLTLGYMLPWAIAATRNKSNTAMIALINLLLGWSLVGWIVALVLSLTSEPQPVVYVNTAIIPTQYPAYGPPAAQTPMLPSPQPNQWSQLPQQPPPPTYGYPQPPYGQHQPPYGQPQQGSAQHGPAQLSEPTAILPPYDENPWRRPDGNDYR